MSEFFSAESCRLQDFKTIVETDPDPSDYRYASGISDRTVVYDASELRKHLRDPEAQRAILTELAAAFSTGPGIVAFERALTNDLVDAASDEFDQIIAEQRTSETVAGDHFAKPGDNDRIWNALQKLALRAPEVFCDYYANDIIELVSLAWLGPGYQITSQVNVVNPGGEAQQPHRDYHLGFMTDSQSEQYPAHVHRLSPALTLQGAVAHCDMPVETGPTMYLPNSQKYAQGYLAWRRLEFREYFGTHRIQLGLAKGDAVFFNPALFHAAGTNTTRDVRRMANLLQISSPFGVPMEALDFDAMCTAVYPYLLRRAQQEVGQPELDRVIAACTAGYAFPTNLDQDQPVDGLAPPSQGDVVRRALQQGWSPQRLTDCLRAHAERRSA